MTQWDFQNKGKSGWTGTSSFVLGVPLRHLRPSVIYSVPCDWILQMAYLQSYHRGIFIGSDKEKELFFCHMLVTRRINIFLYKKK